MNRTHAKIGSGLRKFLHRDAEIVSGTVVAGSYDSDDFTIMVLPTDGADAIGPVMLNGIGGNGNGLLIVPADGSDVVIGCVDGPGEWTLIRASDLVQLVVTIGATTLTIKDGLIQMNDGSFGGLVEVAALVGKINKLENDLNSIKAVFASEWIVSPNDGGAALKVAAAGWAGQSLTATERDDLENTKVKHG